MALRKRTDAYWQKRAEQRLTQSERATKKNMRELRKIYADARQRTIKQIQNIYAAYYKDEGFDAQALRSIVPSGELKRFLTEMKKLGLKTNLPDNYNARVTRLRLINEQLAAEAHQVASGEQALDTQSLRKTFEDAYYQSGFDVARGLGSTPVGFGSLDTQTMNQVLDSKFEGRNFSSRVWTNSDILASKLKNTLAVAIANGQSVYKTSAEVRNDFGVGQYYAERLIRTESNHFHNEGELEAYKQMGFEKFKFLAVLDNRTSEICQEMDGKIFKVSEGIPGDNVPPLHPNCRSTIVPYFKDYEPETRLYRNPETGKNGYTYSATYEDWKQTLPRSEKDERGNVRREPNRKDTRKTISEKKKTIAEKIGVTERYWKKDMEDGERWFAEHYDKPIKWINKYQYDETGKLIATNDYIKVETGIEYELKTLNKAKKYYPIKEHIKRAVEKSGKEHFMIATKDGSFSKKLKEQLSRYNINNPNYQIKELVVYSAKHGEEVINLKTK